MFFKYLFSSKPSGRKEKKVRKHGICDGKYKEAAPAAQGNVIKQCSISMVLYQADFVCIRNKRIPFSSVLQKFQQEPPYQATRRYNQEGQTEDGSNESFCIILKYCNVYQITNRRS
jgi:hypothetical protein